MSIKSTNAADPYEVLGLSSDCTEREIRQKYLALVRQFPPDRHPEQFARVHLAYEQANDPIRRWSSVFLDDDASDIEGLISSVAQRVVRIPTDLLLASGY